MGMLMSTG
uniref:Uncharacterized protein n=1 Tax=Anguilla anguilla TaxID=7936 RepID=A0A0E9SQK0_ANGAN